MIQPSFKKRILIILSYFLIMLFVGGFLSILIRSSEILTNQELLKTNLIVYFILTIVMLIFVYKNLMSEHDSLPDKSQLIMTSLKYTAILYVISLATSLLVNSLSGLETSDNQAILVEMFAENKWLIAMMTIFFAPIVEEIVFRYAMISFEPKNRIWTLVLSSFLFGFIHVSSALQSGNLSDLTNIIIYLVLGLVLGTIYLKKQKLIYPILVHGFYNAISVLFMFLAS